MKSPRSRPSRRITIVDVARHAAVSTKTVSRVLNNRRRTYLTSINVGDVIRCGPAQGPAFAKTLHEPGAKRHNWFVNRESMLYYFFFEKKGARHIIILELSDDMVALIRSKKYLQRGAWYEADGTQNYGKGIS